MCDSRVFHVILIVKEGHVWDLERRDIEGIDWDNFQETNETRQRSQLQLSGTRPTFALTRSRRPSPRFFFLLQPLLSLPALVPVPISSLYASLTLPPTAPPPRIIPGFSLLSLVLV